MKWLDYEKERKDFIVEYMMKKIREKSSLAALSQWMYVRLFPANNGWAEDVTRLIATGQTDEVVPLADADLSVFGLMVLLLYSGEALVTYPICCSD